MSKQITLPYKSKKQGEQVVLDFADFRLENNPDLFRNFYNLGKKLDTECGTTETASIPTKTGRTLRYTYLSWVSVHTVLKFLYGDEYQRLDYLPSSDKPPYYLFRDTDEIVPVSDENGVVRTERVRVYLVDSVFKLKDRVYKLWQPLNKFSQRGKEPELYRAADTFDAKQRTFVKAVAVHLGLGLHLWEKEDLAGINFQQPTPPAKATATLTLPKKAEVAQSETTPHLLVPKPKPVVKKGVEIVLQPQVKPKVTPVAKQDPAQVTVWPSKDDTTLDDLFAEVKGKNA